MEQQNKLVPLGDLLTPDALAEASNGTISLNQVRWQLRHRNANGLAAATAIIGRRLLISKTRYESWLASQFGA